MYCCSARPAENGMNSWQPTIRLLGSSDKINGTEHNPNQVMKQLIKSSLYDSSLGATRKNLCC